MDGPKYISHSSIVYWGEVSRPSYRRKGPALIREEGEVYFSTNAPQIRSRGRDRNSGPALISPTGYIAFYVDGKLHRTDGPAVIDSIGTKEYFVDDVELTQLEFFTTYGVV